MAQIGQLLLAHFMAQIGQLLLAHFMAQIGQLLLAHVGEMAGAKERCISGSAWCISGSA
jgi:hypothetical protein